MNYLKFFNTGGKVMSFLTPASPIQYLGNLNHKKGTRFSQYDFGTSTLYGNDFYNDDGTLKEDIDTQDFSVYNAINKLASSGKHIGRKANLQAIQDAASGIENSEDRQAFIQLQTDAYETQRADTLEKVGNTAAKAAKNVVGVVGAFGGLGGMNGADAFSNGVDYAKIAAENPEDKMAIAGAVTGIVGGAATTALNAVDKATMGDKNFSASSQALDTAVHGVSGALIKSGNPWAIGAGVALEGINWITKAGGRTVQGYDVNINNSGYGNLGHQESESGRIWDKWSGATARKLARRNENARMALAAADISEDVAFEQEARANSVDDVIQQNEIALQGGVDTSLLAAKQGAKLNKKEVIHYYQPEVITYYQNEIVSAKNGTKLEEIEVSTDPNVIPEGALHKNKNHLDLDNITSKGIPVLTVDDPDAETFEDIKASEDSIQQHAEIEDSEIIFNKELTLFIENMRKLWHEKDKKDDSVCLEAGMRLAKEIVENTEDNTDVTQKAIEAVENENT